jgi:apolipoprotein D and lipocalin family protein
MADPQAEPLPSRREVDPDDLEARIRQAEQRLMAREEDLRRRLGALGVRARQAATPRRLVGPLAGLGLAVLGLRWLFKGRDAGRLPRAAADNEAAAEAPHEWSWVRLVGLAWPLLPVAWRSRISPATATTLMTLGLPLIERLIAQRHTAPAPLVTVVGVDLGRFAGTWYEVARLPPAFERACDGPSRVDCQPSGDGRLGVEIRGPGVTGPQRVLRGVARPVPGGLGGKLELSFWPAWLRGLPLAWRPCWILRLDKDYTSALVGSPDRRFLQVLSRQPQLAPARLQALVATAREQGFDVERLKVYPPG